jgi:hypothetical protein
MRPGIIALSTGLLPILAIHTSYLIAAIYEHVPWCIPYIDSCTSISATGRKIPEYFVFKATMIPAAMLMVMFWYLCYQWLLAAGSARNSKVLSIPVLGTVAALFLILYTTMLGASGDLYRLERRIGVIIYFSFTYLAQLLFTYQMGRINNQLKLFPGRIYHFLVGLNTTVLSIGLLSLILDITMADYDSIEDAIEWILALLMHIYFFGVYTAWRRTEFAISFKVRGKGQGPGSFTNQTG